MEMVLRAVGFLLFLGVVFGLLELVERVSPGLSLCVPAGVRRAFHGAASFSVAVIARVPLWTSF